MKDIKGCQTFLSLKAENFGVFLCHTATLNLREYLRWGLKSNSLHGHYLSENEKSDDNTRKKRRTEKTLR